MTYKITQKRLNSDEVMEVIRSIPMENWEQRYFHGDDFNFHAYHTIGGNEVHVEISGCSDRMPGSPLARQAQKRFAQAWVDGYPIGESHSKAICNVRDSIVEWKNGRDAKFVELIRVNRELVQTEAVTGIRDFLGTRRKI